MLNSQLFFLDARTIANPERMTGVGTITYLLADYLDKHGIGINLLFDQEPLVSFSHHRSHILASRSRPAWEQWLLPKFLRQKKATLFHATWNYGLPWYGYRGKTVLTVHDLIPLETPPKRATPRDLMGYAYYRYATSQDISRADRIVTVSETSQLAIIRHYPAARNKTTVVTNAIHPVFFTNYAAGPPPSTTYLLYVGGLDQRKNIELIIQALALLPERIALRITGEANGFETVLARLAQKYNVNRRVHFTGYVPRSNLAKLMQEALAVVYPSLAEGFGLPIIEALATGVPVIASNIPVFRELGGHQIRLINPRKTEELRDAVKSILALSTAERRKEIQRGQAYAKQFSSELLGEKMLKVYDQVSL